MLSEKDHLKGSNFGKTSYGFTSNKSGQLGAVGVCPPVVSVSSNSSRDARDLMQQNGSGRILYVGLLRHYCIEPQCFYQMFPVETSIDNKTAQMCCLLFFFFFSYLSLWM